jgi:hypothetical protein
VLEPAPRDWWESAIEFAHWFRQENGRGLRVDEFIPMYRKHIRGEDIELQEPPQDYATEFDNACNEEEPRFSNPWVMLSSAIESILPQIAEGEGRGVQGLKRGIELIRDSLPAAMQELGLTLPAVLSRIKAGSIQEQE